MATALVSLGSHRARKPKTAVSSTSGSRTNLQRCNGCKITSRRLVETHRRYADLKLLTSWGISRTIADQVTLFGESAGAVSIGDLYLNSNLEKLARGAVCLFSPHVSPHSTPTATSMTDIRVRCSLFPRPLQRLPSAARLGHVHRKSDGLHRNRCRGNLH